MARRGATRRTRSVVGAGFVVIAVLAACGSNGDAPPMSGGVPSGIPGPSTTTATVTDAPSDPGVVPPAGVAGTTEVGGGEAGMTGGTEPTDPEPAAGTVSDPPLDVTPPVDASGPAEVIESFSCPGGAIAPGNNTLTVSGRARSFYAEFPASTVAPMGVVFSWHGFNQDPVSHRLSTGLAPDANPSQPLIIVTPDDVDFEIPVGLDWQLDAGEPDANVDLAFFEAMLGCLNAQYEIDPVRIYSLGFSAGSVMTSLIHSRYPRLVSAAVCISGMWFNDQAEVDLINLVQVNPTWPPLDPADGGSILLTHGGPGDVTVLNVANLENMAQAAFPFLAAANRVVVDCAHNNGHAGHPEVTPQILSKFLSDHRGGEASPYLTGQYSGFPTSCMLRLP